MVGPSASLSRAVGGPSPPPTLDDRGDDHPDERQARKNDAHVEARVAELEVDGVPTGRNRNAHRNVVGRAQRYRTTVDRRMPQRGIRIGQDQPAAIPTGNVDPRVIGTEPFD